jgi:hypothetical protein
MKLVTYDAGNGPRAGVIVDEHVLDTGTLLASRASCVMYVLCWNYQMIR